jgi:hypothetical protein
MNRSPYRALSAAALAMLALIVGTFVAARPASGQADVGRFAFQHTFADSGGNECLPPELSGAVRGTVTGRGQFVATASGYHERLTTNLAYRIDFPDGSYALGTAVERGLSNVNPRNSRITAHVTVREPRTLYAADGQPIGRVMIHYLVHLTYSDVNGDGQPDPGEITASVESFRLACY